jgi:hypothetical protein
MVSKPDRPASIEHEQAFTDRLNEIVDVAHAGVLAPGSSSTMGISPPASVILG